MLQEYVDVEGNAFQNWPPHPASSTWQNTKDPAQWSLITAWSDMGNCRENSSQNLQCHSYSPLTKAKEPGKHWEGKGLYFHFALWLGSRASHKRVRKEALCSLGRVLPSERGHLGISRTACAPNSWKSKKSRDKCHREQRHPFPLVPLGAALGSEHRVHGRGLWALSWERRVCRRKHTLCRLRVRHWKTGALWASKGSSVWKKM